MWRLIYVTALQFVVDLKAFRDFLKGVGMQITLGFSASNPMPQWVYQMVQNPTIGDWFMLSIPIAAIERIAFTVIATFVGVGVIMAIGKMLFKQPKGQTTK
ncbi:MAG: hypothetical protein ACPL0C_01880 [Candidatus Bathyarchaeales archaeon]